MLMKNLIRPPVSSCAPLAFLTADLLARSASQPIPRLEKRGQTVQLIVDGKPYLALAGETSNTASSSPRYWIRCGRSSLR